MVSKDGLTVLKFIQKHWQKLVVGTILLISVLFVGLISTEKIRAIETLRIVSLNLENKAYDQPFGYSDIPSAISIVFNGGGACGEQTTVLRNALSLQGIKTRVIELITCNQPPCGHTLLEAKLNGKWQLLDSYSGVYFNDSIQNIFIKGDDYPITINPNKKNIVTATLLKSVKQIMYRSDPYYIYIIVTENGQLIKRTVGVEKSINKPDMDKMQKWVLEGKMD
jgi:hypothetical protein